MPNRNIVWLASYPKSGNTWVRLFLSNYLSGSPADFDLNTAARHIISEASLGVFREAGLPPGFSTPDVYRVRPAVQRQVAERTPRLRLVKTHLALTTVGTSPTIVPEITAGALYFVRNPFDVAVSMASFFRISIDDAVEGLLYDRSELPSTDTQVHQLLGSWSLHVASWVGARGIPCRAIRYEDLLADPLTGFGTILRHLNIDVDDEMLRRAVANVAFPNLRRMEAGGGFEENPNSGTVFFRSGTAHDYLNHLSRRQIDRIAAGCRPILERFYPELLESR